MTPLIVLTNGRTECIEKSIPSAIENLFGWDELVVVDDSGDESYRDWILDTFDRVDAVHAAGVASKPNGYNVAMQEVWRVGRAYDEPVFFLEDDFLFNRAVDIDEMRAVLDHGEYIQVALLRQAWFANEVEHGGLIRALEQQGQQFVQQTVPFEHIVHRAVFTGNPTLIPQSTLAVRWPSGDWSESRMRKQLFRDPQARGAYMGHLNDKPWVTHIGQRTGFGY